MKKIIIFSLCIFLIAVRNGFSNYQTAQYELTVANIVVDTVNLDVTFDVFISTTNSGDTIFLYDSHFYFTYNYTNFKNYNFTLVDGPSTNFWTINGTDASQNFYSVAPNFGAGGSDVSLLYIDISQGPEPTNASQFKSRVACITHNYGTNYYKIGTFMLQSITPQAKQSGSIFGLAWDVGTFAPAVATYQYGNGYGTPYTPLIQLSGTPDPVPGPIPLPVTMAYFNSQVNNNNVKLSWETTYEYNNANFIIERLISGSNTWSNIGTVPGHGNSNSPNRYVFEDPRLSTNTYKYRLKQVDYNGNFEYFNLNNTINIGKPGSFSLGQSYPNPSNPNSKIEYQIPFDSRVKIVVYDLLGREVVKLVDENKQAGYYSTIFDGTNYASGVYIYRITAENSISKFEKSMKMVLIK